MNIETLDIVIFVVYLLVIFGIGQWVSRDKKGHQKNTEDYFLASKSLPWWAIGASLIAANISAEQFIGMSGSGFAIGLAIASYEWMAAITLLVVGKFFLPIFIQQKIYTIPQFVEKRFSENLKTILAVFWIALFVFVNLASVLYLGAKALDTIIGAGDGSTLLYFVIGLSLFTLAYSLKGGLSSVAWTDVVQVVVLVVGGLITTFIALNMLGAGEGIITGFNSLLKTVPEKFSMILSKNEVVFNGKDAWWDLPGLTVLFGGMWVANIYYWGFNQYIIQRALAGKSLAEAQKGIIFAGFLKILMPFIVVIPGIVAYVMLIDPNTGTLALSSLDEGFIGSEGAIVADNAFPWLIKNIVPIGVKGLILAAITAAIVSSLASMINSTATIFSMDLYKAYFNKEATAKQMVSCGRWTAFIALFIASLISLELANIGQAFQFIQEYTGIVSPGILAIFLMGLFSKKATNKAAIWGAIFSIAVAFYFKVGPKGWSDSSLFVVLPFLDQMFWTCLLSLIMIWLISYFQIGKNNDPKALHVEKDTFKTPTAFSIGATVIILLTACLYALFW